MKKGCHVVRLTAGPTRCYGHASSDIRADCGKRRASNLARPLRLQWFACPSSSLDRCYYLMSAAGLPVILSLTIRSIPYRLPRIFSAPRPPVTPIEFSAIRRAFVSARRKPELRRHIPRRNFHEHNNTDCIRWYLAQIQLRQHFRKVVPLDRF